MSLFNFDQVNLNTSFGQVILNVILY